MVEKASAMSGMRTEAKGVKYCTSARDRIIAYLRGLVFKAQRLLYHSTLGSRVIKKKKKFGPET